MSVIIFGKTICPLLSIGRDLCACCVTDCAMIKTYNIGNDETISYCTFSHSAGNVDG